ncbi:glycosyltransferase family 2 protein [Dokdonia sp. Asnod3-C12]|uniref:glycosyltransferase family 2 protein n=1 Tax=Dokdonia sp. Asnod3-C12 TaxID=3160575 RepID=UPI003867D6E0
MKVPMYFEELNILRDEEPTVSVFVLCYNQEPYILQTIESILSQKTNFPFAIIISDDSSSDKTPQICESLAAINSNITFIKQEKNLGLMGNFVKTSKWLRGKYVAICDGDDYWINNNKLQLQVDFLEKNKEYSVVGTSCFKSIGGKINEIDIDKYTGPIALSELSLENKIIAPTAVFLNVYRVLELPQFFHKFPYGDWPSYLLVMSLTNTAAFKLAEVTAVYRSTIGVSARMREDNTNVAIRNLEIIKNLTHLEALEPNEALFKNSLEHHQLALVTSYNRDKKFLRGAFLMLQILKSNLSLTLFKRYIYSLKKSIV